MTHILLLVGGFIAGVVAGILVVYAAINTAIAKGLNW